jgi:hypothetical protein
MPLANNIEERKNKMESKTFEQGLIESKTFKYQVVAFDEVRERQDGNGFYYWHGCDIAVTAENEEQALKLAELLVSRKQYAVFNILEI